MATVYIATTGSDSNTYAQAQVSTTPRLTLAKAEASATTGDTIVVAAGQYNFASTTFTKSFTWTATGAVIIDGAGASRTWQNSTAAGSQTMTGFKFQYITSTGSVFYGGIWKFYNCQLGTYAKPLLFAGASGFGGMYDFNLGGYINFVNCLVVAGINNAAASKSIGMCAAHSANWTFASGALWTNTTFFMKDTGTSPTVFWECQNGGVLGTAVTIKNCIFYKEGSAMSFYDARMTPVLTYCTFNNVTLFAGTGNVTRDPLFISPSTENFSLTPASLEGNSGDLV